MDELAALAAVMAAAGDVLEVDDVAGRPLWHLAAECRGTGPELFYATDPGSLDAARAFCRRCAVAVECTEAGAREPFGIWGGTTPTERRRRRRNRSAA